MYGGCRAVFYVDVFVEVSPYIDSYDDVEVHDGREAEFL